MKRRYIRNAHGAVAISTILIMGGIVVETAVAAVLAVFLVSQQGLGLRAAYSASLAAHAGVNDAVLKVVRNGADYSGEELSVPIGNFTAMVSSTKSDAGGDSKFTIRSSVTNVGKVSTIEGIVVVDSNSHKSQIELIEPVAD